LCFADRSGELAAAMVMAAVFLTKKPTAIAVDAFQTLKISLVRRLAAGPAGTIRSAMDAAT